MATIASTTPRESIFKVNPNIPAENRELFAADLQAALQVATKAREYRVQSALVDAIAQLRQP